MSDLNGVLQTILALKQEATKPQLLTIPGMPAHIQHFWKPDGTFIQFMVDPPTINVKLGSLAAFIEYAMQYGTSESVILFSEAEVVLYMNYNNRRDQARLPLNYSHPFSALLGVFASKASMDHLAFLRFLKYELRGCLPPDSKVCAAISSMKWSSVDELAQQQAHGAESLGRSITNAAHGGERPVPEEVVLKVQVFKQHDYQAFVPCSIEILPAEKKFRLVPYPGAADTAVSMALDSIQSHFRDSELAVSFNGKL